MLLLRAKERETIQIGESQITLARHRGHLYFFIDAPRSVQIKRLKHDARTPDHKVDSQGRPLSATAVAEPPLRAVAGYSSGQSGV